MNNTYTTLFQPFTFPCGVEIKNRILMAPMTNWSGNSDGTVSSAELAYYRKRAKNIGTIITAACYVMPEGKGFHGQFGAHTDDMIPSLQQLATTIHEQGAKAILQIYHGGRMCPPGVVPHGELLSASAVAAAREGAIIPREMTEAEISSTIHAFGQATRRAIEAGFDGVELHGANTYLIQQFFSPHSNRRQDAWGGSLKKRMAFPLALIDETLSIVNIHAEQPFIVGYRFSPEEIEEPGITLADTLALLEAFTQKKLDYLHLSVMDFWSSSLRDKHDKKPVILAIQEQLNRRIPLIGVGSIRTPDHALRALKTGVPLIAVGRELIMEPDWIEKIKSDQVESIQTTLSKERQQELVIPDGLWQVIINSPGWFPIV